MRALEEFAQEYSNTSDQSISTYDQLLQVSETPQLTTHNNA